MQFSEPRTPERIAKCVLQAVRFRVPDLDCAFLGRRRRCVSLRVLVPLFERQV